MVLIGSIVGYPLIAATTTLLDLPNTMFAIAMRVSVLASSILLIGLALLRGARVSAPVVLVFAAFWALYIIRLTYSTTASTEPLSLAPIEYWIWAIGACFLPALAIILSGGSVNSEKLISRLVVAVFVAAVLVFLATSANSERLDAAVIHGRLQLETLNPISLGRVGALTLIACLWLFLTRKLTITNLALSIGFAAIGLYLLAASGARGAVVALAVPYALVLLLRLGTRRGVLFFAATCAAGYVGLLFLPLIEDYTGTNLTERLESGINRADAAAQSREDSFRGALEGFFQSPITGSGLEDSVTQFYPHNLLLEAFMATGALGGILFAVLVVVALVRSVGMIARPAAPLWLPCVFVFFAISSMFSGALYSFVEFWAMLGLMLSSFAPEFRKDRNRRAPAETSQRLAIDRMVAPPD